MLNSEEAVKPNSLESRDRLRRIGSAGVIDNEERRKEVELFFLDRGRWVSDGFRERTVGEATMDVGDWGWSDAVGREVIRKSPKGLDRDLSLGVIAGEG